MWVGLYARQRVKGPIHRSKVTLRHLDGFTRIDRLKNAIDYNHIPPARLTWSTPWNARENGLTHADHMPISISNRRACGDQPKGTSPVNLDRSSITAGDWSCLDNSPQSF